MWDRDNAPRVLGPPGTKHFCSMLFEGGAFDADFRARAAYPRRQENLVAVRPDVREVAPGVAYEDAEVQITCDHVDHIPAEISECFGIRLEAEGKAIAFSGDTAPCERMVELARDVDILFHECTFPETFIAHRRKTGVGIVAHTSPTELGRIARAAHVKRLVPTHFGHFESTNEVIRRCSTRHFPIELMGPHLMEEVERDIRIHYDGPMTVARDLLQIEL
jgi:ribonuclease Z